MSFLFVNKTLWLNNLKTKTATNAKILVHVICVEAIIYLLLYNLHGYTFKSNNFLNHNLILYSQTNYKNYVLILSFIDITFRIRFIFLKHCNENFCFCNLILGVINILFSNFLKAFGHWGSNPPLSPHVQPKFLEKYLPSAAIHYTRHPLFFHHDYHHLFHDWKIINPISQVDVS